MVHKWNIRGDRHVALLHAAQLRWHIHNFTEQRTTINMHIPLARCIRPLMIFIWFRLLLFFLLRCDSTPFQHWACLSIPRPNMQKLLIININIYSLPIRRIQTNYVWIVCVRTCWCLEPRTCKTHTHKHGQHVPFYIEHRCLHRTHSQSVQSGTRKTTAAKTNNNNNHYKSFVCTY